MEINSAELNEPPKLHIKIPTLKKGPTARIWQMIIGGIAALVYLFWIGNKYLGTPPQFENAKVRADVALAAKVSEQAGPTSDLNKVKPADRQAFLYMLRGAPVDPRTVLVRIWQSKHQSAQAKMQNSWQNFWKSLHWFP